VGKLSQFFWDTREDEGEFSFFIRHDRRFVTLTPGKRFGDDVPYNECFLVMRTTDGRYYLRWPQDYGQVPAYYFGPDGAAMGFFPRQDHGEDLDFEEIFPGWTYEVFGVQFQLPNIGTDYRAFEEIASDREIDEEGAAPAQQTNARRIQELLAILEGPDLDPSDARELGKHFRRISIKYHPLKHLNASDKEKAKINEKYLAITNAYNELKAAYR
jgi:hypothetical protein